MRQHSEHNWACVRVGMWCCLPDLAYAACSTAHTSPHRSTKSRRWSAKDTVSFMRWRWRTWSRTSSWAVQKRAADANEPKPRRG